MNWRVVLIAGVCLSILLALGGLIIDRNEIGVLDPQGVYYAHQWPTPFEREVFLEPDHHAMLSEGDSELWYFTSGAVLALTLASLPLLIDRELRRKREARADESPPEPREA